MSVQESGTVLAAKLGVGLLCAVMTLLLVRHPKPYELSRQRFDLGLMILMAAMRLSLFVVVYLVLDINVSGDVRGFYFPNAERAAAGEVIYRDFESSYSPLFPYLLALIIGVWHSLKAIVLAAILIEVASLPLWLAAGRRWFSERTVRVAALLYVTSSVPFLNIALKGQNQVWVALGLAASVWLLARKDVLSGGLQGLTLISVKVLSLLFTPVIWLFAGGRVRWAIAFCVLPLATVLYCVPNDIDLLFPLRLQGGHFTGGNLPYLTSLFGVDPTAGAARWIFDGLTVGALAFVFLASWKRGVRAQPANVMHLLTLVLMTFFLASKKAYATYLVMCFFPVCLTLATSRVNWKLLIAFAMVGILAALEPSLHFRWMHDGAHKQFLSVLFADPLPEGVTRIGALAFLLVDVALVAGYAVVAGLAWRRLGTAPPTHPPQAG